MTMMNTDDDNEVDSNQEVTNPEKGDTSEYQSQLAEVLRKEKHAPVPTFKKQNLRTSLDTTEIVQNQKNDLIATPPLSHGASLLTNQTSHIYSEQVSKLSSNHLLDS